MRFRWVLVLGTILWGCGVGSQDARSASSPESGEDAEYRLYVANESSDVVSRVLFSPGAGAQVEGEIQVGVMPGDLDAPHGLAVSPDGNEMYVTLAHGRPYGSLWKYHAGPDTLVGRMELGRFPASVGVDPSGRFAFVVNFNLHGEMVPSDLSVVDGPELRELTRIPTCVMPHGSRVDPQGRYHYSVCMHSDQLVQVELAGFRVSGRYSLVPGQEEALALDDQGEMHGHHDDPGPMVHIPEEEDGRPLPRPEVGHDHGPLCSPTWVTPGRGDHEGRVYVACNGADRVVEVDVEGWEVLRSWETGGGPYNLELSPDGRLLVVTLRGEGGVEVWDLDRGERRARLETTRPVTHGVVVSPDNRYAFVSNEGVGAERGTMDVFDLAALERVASVELRHQPTGIDLWRVDRGNGGG